MVNETKREYKVGLTCQTGSKINQNRKLVARRVGNNWREGNCACVNKRHQKECKYVGLVESHSVNCPTPIPSHMVKDNYI